MKQFNTDYGILTMYEFMEASVKNNILLQTISYGDDIMVIFIIHHNHGRPFF